MKLCETCMYNPWDPNAPVTEDQYTEMLGQVGISPTGEGMTETVVGSPFRYPKMLIVRLCCLDKQMCDKKEVDFVALNNQTDSDATINDVREAVLREAGLPFDDGQA